MLNINFIKAVNDLDFKHAVSQISNDLGVSKGTVSSYYNGNIKASDPFLEKFANFYKISLQTLKDTPSDSINPTLSDNKGAPYYDVDFIGGFDLIVNNQTTKPSFYIDFLPYNDVDCWVNVTGKSMSPFISHGDIVALKRVENWKEFLLFGEIYAVVTDDFRTIKIIGKSDIEKSYRLIPYSKSPEFSEQDIPIKLINHIYRVKGSMKKFF